MVKLRSDEDKRLAALPILEAGLPLVQALSIGDEVGVHVLGSSWDFYGGDPAAPAKALEIWTVESDLQMDANRDFKMEISRKGRRAYLLVRPNYNNSIMRVRRNKDGHPTTGSWVRVSSPKAPAAAALGPASLHMLLLDRMQRQGEDPSQLRRIHEQSRRAVWTALRQPVVASVGASAELLDAFASAGFRRGPHQLADVVLCREGCGAGLQAPFVLSTVGAAPAGYRSRPSPVGTLAWRVLSCPWPRRESLKELAAELRNRCLDLRRRPLYYASGSEDPGYLQGFAATGHPVGLSAPRVSSRVERMLPELGVPVFLDSGAFGEVRFGKAGPYTVRPLRESHWRSTMELYLRLAGKLRHRLSVVAPDKVGDQQETLSRMKRWAPYLRACRDAGARVILPIQRGKLSPAAMWEQALEVTGLASWEVAAGIPSKKAATPLPELVSFLEEAKPTSIHLLGLGSRAASWPKVEAACRQVLPDLAISHDSVRVLGLVGRQGATRPLTQALDQVREELDNARWQAPESSEADFTDLLYTPSEWMPKSAQKAYKRSLASLGYKVGRNLDAWLQANADDWIDAELRTAWDTHWRGRAGAEERKRRAVEEVLVDEATVFKTPGTRMKWSSLEQWLAAWRSFARPGQHNRPEPAPPWRLSSKWYGRCQAHVAALAAVPHLLEECDDLTTIKDVVAVLGRQRERSPGREQPTLDRLRDVAHNAQRALERSLVRRMATDAALTRELVLVPAREAH